MATDRTDRPPEPTGGRDPVDEAPAPAGRIVLSLLVLLGLMVGYLIGWRIFLLG